MDKEYTKDCPQCGKKQNYVNKHNLKKAIKNDTICIKCINTNIKRKTFERNIIKKNIFERKCPNCDKIITYKKSSSLITAIKKNSLCRECGCGHCSLTVEEKREREKTYRRLPEIKKRRREYQKERRKNPMIKLGGNISGAIRRSLKTKNLSKNKRHWEDIVGYTVQDLKQHLENLFQTGMDWNNREKWHIDHRIPITFFQYNSTDDVEFKYCWSLNNLQPLWAEDNISKTDRILKKYLKN